MNEPIRGLNIINLILTDDNDLVYSCNVTKLSLSDHDVVLVPLLSLSKLAEGIVNKRDEFPDVNYFSDRVNLKALIREAVCIQWDVNLKRSVEEAFGEIIRKVFKCSRRYVSERRNPQRSVILRDRLIIIQNRNRLHCQTKPACRERLACIEKRIQYINIKLQQSVEKEI